MSGRELSSAEVRQRREAAVTHGAHAQTKNVLVIERRWRRLRRGLNRRGVRVTEIRPRDWQLLRIFCARLVVIERVMPVVLDHLDADPESALTSDLMERLSGWLAAATDIVKQLPGELSGAVEGDLASALALRRRGGAA